MVLSKQQEMGTAPAKAEVTKKAGQLNKRVNLLRCVSVVFLVLGLAGLAVAIGLFYATTIATHEYGIVLDAGSSHTTLYIYHWESDKINGTGKVEEISECDADPLSDFASHPDDAGPALAACLKKAKDPIPWPIRQYTPVYLGATAGMRILQLKDPALGDRLMKSVREEVLSTPFQVADAQRQVQIISGQDEGIGLWVTANYVGGSLGNILSPDWIQLLPLGDSKTLGVMDMGGASTQVAFAVDPASKLPAGVTQKVTLFSSNLHLFSDSFLCYGLNEMRNRVLAILAKDNDYSGNVTHPCFAQGSENTYTYDEIFESLCTAADRAPAPLNSSVTYVGSGDNSRCTDLVARLFNKTECPYSSCSFEGRVLPALPDRLLARGGFAYAANDIDSLDDQKQTNYTRFSTKLQQFCEKPLSELSAMDHLYDASTVCVNGHYTRYLLSNVYNISDDAWSQILFSNKIGGISMGWSLGYMTNITSTLPKVPRLKLFHIDLWVFILVTAITCTCIIIGIITCALSIHIKRKRYELLSNQNYMEPF